MEFLYWTLYLPNFLPFALKINRILPIRNIHFITTEHFVRHVYDEATSNLHQRFSFKCIPGRVLYQYLTHTLPFAMFIARKLWNANLNEIGHFKRVSHRFEKNPASSLDTSQDVLNLPTTQIMWEIRIATRLIFLKC